MLLGKAFFGFLVFAVVFLVLLFLRGRLVFETRLRALLIGPDLLDELVEVLLQDGSFLTGTLDTGLVQVSLVYLVPITRKLGQHLAGATAELHGVIRDVWRIGRFESLDVLEENLAVRPRASDLGDVQAHGAAELHSRWGGVYLDFLGALSEKLDIFLRDLVVFGRTFEALGDFKPDVRGVVRGLLGCELGSLLHLGGFRKLLRQEALGGQEGHGLLDFKAVGLSEQLEDLGEGRSGGCHGFVAGLGVFC